MIWDSETQIKLGQQVFTWPVGQLANEIGKVADEEVEAKVNEYKTEYELNTNDLHARNYQAREEIAMERILRKELADAENAVFNAALMASPHVGDSGTLEDTVRSINYVTEIIPNDDNLIF